MTPIDVICTADEFKSLRCPYTGEPLEVRMLIFPGQPPKFHAPDAYSPSQPFPTAETAYRKWNRENGIEGVKTGLPITCAYTGKMLAAASDREGCYFTGGFDPRLFYTRDEFLRLATSRNGKTDYVPSGERVEAVPPDMTPAKPRREEATEPTDESVKIAADVLQQHKDVLPKQARTTVSMSVRKGTKKA